MGDDIEKHIRRRFDICQRLGKGAYGIVWKAVEKRGHTVVALKKCFDAFRNSTDAQRTYREIMYLQKLAGHDNIARLQHVIKAENDKDIYLTFDHMETDLHAVIRANILEEVHKKYIIYQVLKALKYMHSGALLHRDIKPSNLLLNSDCHVKLCDFGLCRSVADTAGPAPVLTDYARDAALSGTARPRSCSARRATPRASTCGRSAASSARCSTAGPSSRARRR